jgi:hypothetical protein
MATIFVKLTAGTLFLKITTGTIFVKLTTRTICLKLTAGTINLLWTSLEGNFPQSILIKFQINLMSFCFAKTTILLKNTIQCTLEQE